MRLEDTVGRAVRVYRHVHTHGGVRNGEHGELEGAPDGRPVRQLSSSGGLSAVSCHLEVGNNRGTKTGQKKRF